MRARRGDDARLIPFYQHERNARERDEPAQLADERAERLVEVERRAERAGAAVRGVEQIRAPAELVAQRLRLVDARLCGERLLRETHHEPADEQRDQHLDTELERDVLDAVVAAKMGGAQALEPGEDRRRRKRRTHASPQHEERRALDDDEVEHLAQRRPRLPGVQEAEGRGNREVECEAPARDEPGAPAHTAVKRSGADGENGGRRPCVDVVTRRRALREHDLEDRERDGEQTDDRDPAQERLATRQHARPLISASAHRACSSSAKRSRSGSCSAPPVLPSATSALRRSQCASFFGT